MSSGRQHIGPFHWTPAEAFALGRTPEVQERGAAVPTPADELTVISWALSHTDSTKADNRLETELPSERWARSRIFGQSQNRALHRALVTALASQGFSAVAPALLPEHGEKQSESHGRSSNWSERHVAYTSGLGTFSLCGGLITPLGQAVRFGSVVVHASLPPTVRTLLRPLRLLPALQRQRVHRLRRPLPGGLDGCQDPRQAGLRGTPRSSYRSVRAE